MSGFGISSVEPLYAAGVVANDIMVIIATALSLNEEKESMIVKSSLCLGTTP
jgi:hypothetical protein